MSAALAIHIEVVRLDGFSLTPAQTRQFQGALEAELQRLATLHERWRGWSPAALAAESAPPVRLHTRPAQLGVEVGRSLWAALGGQP